MTVKEVASFLLAGPAGLWPPSRRVHNAICLDDGGSTTLAMVDPTTGEASVVNVPSGGSLRAVGSSLAIMISASYSDGRPAAKYRMDAQDHGVVLRHGDGPGRCDILGARDVWVFEADGAYYMHYDAAGPEGWLAVLATSKDLNRWDPAHKAVVPDQSNCTWSKHIIGLPSVVRAGDRLALFYDGNGDTKMPAGVKSHMNRDIGLAWLRLPLVPPTQERSRL